MWSKLNTNLAFKVALYTVLTAALFGLLIGSYQTWSSFQDRKQRTHQAIETLVAITKPSISLATYNYNTLLNQQLIAGLAAHPEISNATITDIKGSEIAIASTTQVCNSSNLNTFLHGSNNQYEFPLNYHNTPLGKLTIELDHCKLTNLFFIEVKQNLISSIILSIIIALFIYIVFYQLVSLPLSKLVQQLQKIDPSSIEFTQLKYFHSPRKDEIGLLINHFAKLLHTTHDHISRLKSAEQTINSYSTDLEGLVNKRTKALTGINRQLKEVNQELEQSKKLSEQLNLSQLKLLTGFSQELNSPISSTIELLSSAQLQCKISAEQTRIQTAIKQNTTIASLLSELEYFANLRNSFDLQQASPLSLITILNTLEQKIRQQAPRLIIDIKYADSFSSSHIGNTLCLEQLLYNLIANAFQYSNEETLKVSLAEVDQSILINLSAHDLHIPQSGLELMILPFSPPPHSQLTTLGLGFANDLAELLAGQIQLAVNSQNEHEISLKLPLLSSDEQLKTIRNLLPSGGIRINIKQPLIANLTLKLLETWQLPFQTSALCSPNPVLLITDQPSTEKDTGFVIGLGSSFAGKEFLNDINLLALEDFNEGVLFSLICTACLKMQDEQMPTQVSNVLIVEDNAINRMLSQRFLKNLNTNIDMAEDGREALVLCNSKKFDLIFMDCQMPVMDGFQATRQIRRSHINQLTPIIALTGLDSENERQACLQAGMNDFITKPYTQEQLHNALLQWLAIED